MKIDPIQQFILANEQNLRIAAAVGEEWPKARAQIASGFLDRLKLRLEKQLKGWEFALDDGKFFEKAWAGYYLGKADWKSQYHIGLQCGESGRQIGFGVSREADSIGKRPHSAEVLDAVKKLHPSASSYKWWEAWIAMRSPAFDWTRSEVLWRMHTEEAFLEDVAVQLLEVTKCVEPILDRLVRKK